MGALEGKVVVERGAATHKGASVSGHALIVRLLRPPAVLFEVLLQLLVAFAEWGLGVRVHCFIKHLCEKFERAHRRYFMIRACFWNGGWGARSRVLTLVSALESPFATCQNLVCRATLVGSVYSELVSAKMPSCRCNFRKLQRKLPHKIDKAD